MKCRIDLVWDPAWNPDSSSLIPNRTKKQKTLCPPKQTAKILPADKAPPLCRHVEKKSSRFRMCVLLGFQHTKSLKLLTCRIYRSIDA